MRDAYLNRRSALLLATAAVLSPLSGAMAVTPESITVHKDPNCGCCTGWVRHLEKSGFTTRVIETSQLDTVKKRLGVPDDLASCHTAEVADYIIEGHVPAAAIKRLLAEKPKARGLAVPGMPIGSPGMEGGVPEFYEVVLFGPQGQKPYMRFKGDRPA